jgi:hypothetical protein
MLGTVTEVSAKFFGTVVVSTTDWADGVNMYRQTCNVTYVFFIAGPVQCSTEIIPPL